MNVNDNFQIPADEQVRQRMRAEMLENLDAASRARASEANTETRAD